MISLNILEVKAFMAKLLTNPTFDSFILRELELHTFANFSISGKLNEGFFTKEELEAREETTYILWGEVRQILFSMIKGNKTPLSLKIVFQAPKAMGEALLHRMGGQYGLEEIGGLYLNVRFEKNELYIISGTAMKTFTLDKTLEQEWDREVMELMRSNFIAFEEG